MRVNTAEGPNRRITPIEELKLAIERYLPPPGEFYDQFTMYTNFDEDYFNIRLDNGGSGVIMKCVCCWQRHHGVPRKKCTKLCSVCKTPSHPGTECPKMYVTLRWLKDHQSLPHGIGMQVRPTPSEQAYLVVAGVLKDWKDLEGPVVVNMDHPLVKAFYEGKAPPHEILNENVAPALDDMSFTDRNNQAAIDEPIAEKNGSAVSRKATKKRRKAAEKRKVSEMRTATEKAAERATEEAARKATERKATIRKLKALARKAKLRRLDGELEALKNEGAAITKEMLTAQAKHDAHRRRYRQWEAELHELLEEIEDDTTEEEV